MAEIQIYGGQGKKKKFGKKKELIFLSIVIFLILLFILVYTAFYGDISFTGNAIAGGIEKVVKSGNENKTLDIYSTGKIKFSAELTVPLLELDSKFKEVQISGNSDSYLYVGNQKFNLKDINENYLIFEDYDGKMSFDSKEISLLKGKSSGVTINGIFVSQNSKNNITKINLDQPFRYKSLTIKDVSIDKLVHKTSGILQLNDKKEIINIKNEDVTVTNFKGNILIKNKKIYLDGFAEKLSVVGDLNINIG